MQMEKALGPSLALTPKRFRRAFGTDDELLTEVEKELSK
jgi:hypothetical protein